MRTVDQALKWIEGRPDWGWTAPYWNPAEVILQKPDGQVTALKGPQAAMIDGAQALGCTGLHADGKFHWIGWDLDVGDHGVVSYPSAKAAAAAGVAIWHYLDGKARVHRSRNGAGVHVLFRPGEPLPKADGIAFAKAVAKALNLWADATPLARQQFWLWTRERKPGAFQVIKDPCA